MSESFELLSLLGFHANLRVQREPRVLRDAFPWLLRSREYALQRKHLLPRPRAHRHSVRDRVPQKIVHRAASGRVELEITAFEIADQDARRSLGREWTSFAVGAKAPLAGMAALNSSGY